MKYEISQYFNEKLKSIPYDYQRSIMDSFGLEWNY